MQIGDRVIDKKNRNYGIGIITEIHAGGRCSVSFDLHHNRVPLASLVSSESEERKQLLQKEKLRLKEKFQQTAFLEINKKFKSHFTSADSFFDDKYANSIAISDYDHEKMSFIRSWFSENSLGQNNAKKEVPDFEQSLAIGSVNGNIQVVARAGSGKTSTLVNRTFFLQEHCHVSPDEILLLAFNRKAVKEISERLTKLSNYAIPHVMTFHALAHAIVHPTQELIYNDTTEGNQGLDSVFWDAIKDRLEESSFLTEVRKLMLAQFKSDWEEIVDGGFDFSPEELYRYQQSLVRETLRGEYVKSHGEKTIANFLFEHDIPYLYEKAHYWNSSIYRPDFTVLCNEGSKRAIIIEYFGLVGDPEYDEEMVEKRQYWEKKADYELIELTPTDFAGGTEAFESKLKHQLQNIGVECSRLTDEEVWIKIKPRAIKRFSSAMSGFVGRCRKAWILPDNLSQMVSIHNPQVEVEGIFLELAVILYGDYLERLDVDNKQDFDGLMQEASRMVAAGKTTFERKNETGDLANLRYVMIDEYQDFSELFHRLIEAIRKRNPNVEFFCVGDDWQAINGFAGSNLKYYREFASYFPRSKQLYISKNYRSVSSVVSVGNKLMANLGKPAISHKQSEGIVQIVERSKFFPTLIEKEKFNNDDLTPIILRIAGKALKAGKSVVLLSRRKDLFIPSGGSIAIEKYLETIQSQLPDEWRKKLTVSTTHRFKGREVDTVIIIDALDGVYPLIHPSWIFLRILGESLESVDAESRRLFYVALTRAKESLFIITEKNKRSPYLKSMQEYSNIPEIPWGDYPPVTGNSEALVVVITGSFYDLTAEFKADGYHFRRNNGTPTREKKYMKDAFAMKTLSCTPWADKSKRMNLKFYVDICESDGSLLDSYSVLSGKWSKRYGATSPNIIDNDKNSVYEFIPE